MIVSRRDGTGALGPWPRVLLAIVCVTPLVVALACARSPAPSPAPEVWVIGTRPSIAAVEVWVANVGTRRVEVGGSTDVPGCWEVAALACGWAVLFPGVPAGTVPAACGSSGPTTCGDVRPSSTGEPNIDDPGTMALRGDVRSSGSRRVVTATIARSGRAAVSGRVKWLATGPEGGEDGVAAAIALGCAAVGNDAEVGSTLAPWLVGGANATGASLLVRRSGRASPGSDPPADRFERLIHELASIDWTACSRP